MKKNKVKAGSRGVKPLRLILILSGLALILSPAPAQVVREKFDKMVISENFDTINTYWTTVANAENLFIVQDGEYILQRKSPAAPFAVMAGFDETFANFRVVTSIKLDKSLSDDASAGLMFMMQPEGDGGFLIELNKKKEYRLRQIVNGAYKYITGSSKDGGWVRNSAVHEANYSNMIELRVFNKNYDLFLNNTFIQSFAEPAYKSGKLGLLIGPASRAKVDFLYVFTIASAEDAQAAAGKDTSLAGMQAPPDIIELAESIIRLKTQLNALTEENEALNQTISAMKSGDAEKDVTLRNNEKQMKALNDEMSKKQNTIDSLKKVNTELEKYREIAGGKENGDLVISLSKTLKAEKEKNAALEEELRELRDQYNIPDTPKNKKSNSSPQGNDTPRSNNTFSLPKDR